ncbi:MAG: AP2/ERF family transcription factor [Anaerolineae bacterium]
MTGRRKIGSIIRIDKRAGKKGGATRGWQVRVPTGEPRKYHSRLFSDSKYGSKGKALVAAEAYLEEYLQAHPVILKQVPPYPFGYKKGILQSNNKSGRSGVCRTHSYHGRTGKKQEFWAAFCPIGPDGRRYLKRFYIVTHGEEEAKRLAIEFREMWEEAAEQGPDAIRRFFTEVEEGWL